VIRRSALLLAVLALLLGVVACRSERGAEGDAAAGRQIRINGAGATFPYPIYSKWFSDYRRARPDVQVNYQSIGSGGGIRQVLQGTVDFGATDGPMSEEHMQQAKGPVLHIPTVLGAVVPAYNLPEVKEEIRFTPEALTGIFLGKVKTWNHPLIAEANPGVALPKRELTVVHRSDGSGTTYVWTDYLSKVSAEWEKTAGRGTSVRWPTGLGAKGNEGVAGMIRQMPGAIGYIELVYAEQNNITHGPVRNAAGEFVKSSVASTTAAAASVEDMPADFRVSITNPPGRDAYPVASFTWLLVPQQIPDATKRQVIVQMLEWLMAAEQQQSAAQLGYAPLPEKVVAQVKEAIATIR
jgi:phosphate transport system substrate-binding protein